MQQTLTAPKSNTDLAPGLDEETVFSDFFSSVASAPAWWAALKKDGWKRFQSLPMPHRKDEDWRFASVNSLNLEGYHLPGSPDEEEREKTLSTKPEIGATAGSIVFADDKLLEWNPIDPELAAKGVIWMPIEEAVIRHPDLLRKHFMAQAVKLGSEKFSALHTAYCSAGILLYVPKNVEISEPFLAVHHSHAEGGAIFPHTLLIADDHAKVTLIDCFLGNARNTRNFACGVNDLYAGPGAQVSYYSAQDWNEGTLAFHLNSTQVFRDAAITSINLNLGGALSRTESHSQILGEGARSEMLSLSVAHGKQEFDQRTLQSHFKGHSVSDLLYKNALLDEARTIFSGLIRVEPEAQQTDAYQTNRNLLLHPTAEANSLPGLEIQANDVKCSHGATTGQIEPAQLFYMASRGVPASVAKKLLVFGFFEEVLEKINSPTVAEFMRRMIREKFERFA